MRLRGSARASVVCARERRAIDVRARLWVRVRAPLHEYEFVYVRAGVRVGVLAGACARAAQWTVAVPPRTT
jgi:hypothetical protein